MDPDKFVAAWVLANSSQTAAFDVMSLTKEPLPMPTREDPYSILKHPLFKQIAPFQSMFPNLDDLQTVLTRMMNVARLAKNGDLGPFYHPQHGIWRDAIRALAEAKHEDLMGFDVEDVKARLAKLEPPPAT